MNNWKRIENLRDLMEDELSVDTLRAFLQGRISANQEFFIDVMVPDQYYPKDIFHFDTKEVMVECGSNDGKTLLEFLRVVHNSYKFIYLFEPDKECGKTLNELIFSHELKNINLIPKGAWDREGKISFVSNAKLGSSHVIFNEESADYSISVGSIDQLVDSEVTFIKMDIEGAELHALKGAENTILKYHPKLAICVYHNPSDFLDIPEYLHRLVPEYRFYLRHHNYGATETVLYAIDDAKDEREKHEF